MEALFTGLSLQGILPEDVARSMDIYLSQTMLYHSLTLLIVGGYLLVIAAVAKALGSVNGGLVLPLPAFFVFLAFLVLTIGLLSDRLRLRMKQLISRHFRRPRYDYRKVWMAFTEQTGALLEKRGFCDAVAKMVCPVKVANYFELCG